MKKVLALLLVLLLALTMVACGETVTPEMVEPNQSEQPAPEPQVELFNIGDTVRMGNLEFTLNSARWDAGDEFMKPDEGERWIVLDCTIKNNGSESTNISSMLMFELIDDQHYSQDLSIFAETKGSLDGELGPGRTMRGEIAYEVSEEVSSFEFIFAPEVFGFGQAIYKFSVDEVQ